MQGFSQVLLQILIKTYVFHVFQLCLLKLKEKHIICQVFQVFHGFQSFGGTYDPGRQQSNSIENNENLIHGRFFDTHYYNYPSKAP